MSPRSYNFSAFTTARKCEQLFAYLYVDRLKSEEQPSGDLTFGSSIHLAIESYLNKNNGVDTFNLYWDIEKDKNNKYSRFNFTDLKKQGQTFLERFERLHLKKFKPVSFETRLYGDIDNEILIEGTPDFVGDFEGVPSIVDFKTSGYAYHKDRIKVAEQQYLYAHLAKLCLGFEAKQIVYLVFIKGTQPRIQTLKCDLDPNMQKSILDEFKLLGKELIIKEHNKQFAKNRGSCIIGENICPFWRVCNENI